MARFFRRHLSSREEVDEEMEAISMIWVLLGYPKNPKWHLTEADRDMTFCGTHFEGVCAERLLLPEGESGCTACLLQYRRKTEPGYVP